LNKAYDYWQDQPGNYRWRRTEPRPPEGFRSPPRALQQPQRARGVFFQIDYFRESSKRDTTATKPTPERERSERMFHAYDSRRNSSRSCRSTLLQVRSCTFSRRSIEKAQQQPFSNPSTQLKSVCGFPRPTSFEQAVICTVQTRSSKRANWTHVLASELKYEFA
jgi:hypothetical protein